MRQKINTVAPWIAVALLSPIFSIGQDFNVPNDRRPPDKVLQITKSTSVKSDASVPRYGNFTKGALYPSTLNQPQIFGCPILRAFCGGWDVSTNSGYFAPSANKASAAHITGACPWKSPVRRLRS